MPGVNTLECVGVLRIYGYGYMASGTDMVEAMADRADSLALFGSVALMDPPWHVGS